MVAKREQPALRGRGAVEPGLRQDRVDDHDRGVEKSEDIRGGDRRKPAYLPGEDEEREQQERLLPRRHDVERPPSNAEIPELGHRGVVQREPDDEDEERVEPEALASSQRSPPT